MGLHVDELATLFACGEHYNSVDEGEQSVVFAHAYIQSGMMLSATLTLQDVSGFAVRPTEDFHTKSFAF